MMEANKLQKVIISFFSPPGSGKGTLAERLVEKFNFKVLSTGQLCRQHVAGGTDFGKKLNVYLKKGALIPDSLITSMVTCWLEDNTKYNQPIILDGFPRTKGQASNFLHFLHTKLVGYCFRVFLIVLSDDEIVKRLTGRRVCENKSCRTSLSVMCCQEEICQKCGNKLVRRDDDEEGIVIERLKAYPVYRNRLLDFYRTVGQTVEKLDVTKMSRNQAFCTFCAML